MDQSMKKRRFSKGMVPLDNTSQFKGNIILSILFGEIVIQSRDIIPTFLLSYIGIFSD